MNTRKLSIVQEKRVSKISNGKVQVGSGSTPFLKGDVVLPNILIDCKTKAKESKSHTIKKEWLDKIKEEAYQMRKECGGLVIDFGDGEDYGVIPLEYLIALNDAYLTCERLVGYLEGSKSTMWDSDEIKAIKGILRGE